MKEYCISFLSEDEDDFENGIFIKCHTLDVSQQNVGVVIADGVEITVLKDIDYITEMKNP